MNVRISCDASILLPFDTVNFASSVLFLAKEVGFSPCSHLFPVSLKNVPEHLFFWYLEDMVMMRMSYLGKTWATRNKKTLENRRSPSERLAHPFSGYYAYLDS
jgi:hypothetical protein